MEIINISYIIFLKKNHNIANPLFIGLSQCSKHQITTSRHHLLCFCYSVFSFPLSVVYSSKVPLLLFHFSVFEQIVLLDLYQTTRYIYLLKIKFTQNYLVFPKRIWEVNLPLFNIISTMTLISIVRIININMNI